MPLTLGVPLRFCAEWRGRMGPYDSGLLGCEGQGEAIRSQNSSETRQIKSICLHIHGVFLFVFWNFPSFQRTSWWYTLRNKPCKLEDTESQDRQCRWSLTLLEVWGREWGSPESGQLPTCYPAWGRGCWRLGCRLCVLEPPGLPRDGPQSGLHPRLEEFWASGLGRGFVSHCHPQFPAWNCVCGFGDGRSGLWWDISVLSDNEPSPSVRASQRIHAQIWTVTAGWWQKVQQRGSSKPHSTWRGI